MTLFVPQKGTFSLITSQLCYKIAVVSTMLCVLFCRDAAVLYKPVETTESQVVKIDASKVRRICTIKNNMTIQLHVLITQVVIESVINSQVIWSLIILYKN